MPLVTIKLAKPELDKAQKEQLIADITELLSTKYGKAKEANRSLLRINRA